MKYTWTFSNWIRRDRTVIGKNKRKRFWKSPGGIALVVITLVAMILAIVVFSAKKEAKIREEQQQKENPEA